MKKIFFNKSKYKILILGINGMIGHKLFNYFSGQNCFETIGVLRRYKNNFDTSKKIIQVNNFINPNKVESLIDTICPSLVINCVGIVKQNPEIKNIENSFYLNSIFPNLLNQICKNKDIRFITFSTDCVFSGRKGFYKEDDLVDSIDTYGRSKFLGELKDHNKSITLRTSFIGKELNTKRGLLEWIISQCELKKNVFGFKRAIYSGLPTIEIAKVIDKFIIPNENLKGLYHLSSEPIDKYTLLNIIKKTYKLDIKINENYDRVIDRSLNSSKFSSETGFIPLNWEELVQSMYKDN